jgi:outer membrane protein TolC
MAEPVAPVAESRLNPRIPGQPQVGSVQADSGPDRTKEDPGRVRQHLEGLRRQMPELAEESRRSSARQAATGDATSWRPNGNVAFRPRTDGPKADGEAAGEGEPGVEELPPAERPATLRGQSEQGTEEATEPDLLRIESLTLADVVASVYRSYPEILQARIGGDVATGELLSAYGSYDVRLQAASLSEPMGFYQTYRNNIGAIRQTWWGGYVSAGYRIGRGFFPSWYGNRETNGGGEFKLSLVQPLLQGYAIDPARVAVFQADLQRQQVVPDVQKTVLMISLDAVRNYWTWVASGKILEARMQLLELAERRGQQFEQMVESGAAPAVDVIFNRQLIAERRLSVLQTQQKFRESAFKLAVFLRDENGQMLMPADAWMPDQFPQIGELPEADFQTDLNNALARRPELQLLGLELRRIQLDLRLAQNQRLPQLDVIVEGSQDVGDPIDAKDSKGPFELLFGVQGEVPVQRRRARGKVQSSQAKLAQLNQEIRLQQDKIASELQTAFNALLLASEGVEQAEFGLRAAVDTLDRYLFAFEQGYVDLIYINLLESRVAESEIKLIETQQNWFEALGLMQAALGLDPIEQAMAVSSLPPGEDRSIRKLMEEISDRELPEPEQIQPEDVPGGLRRNQLQPPNDDENTVDDTLDN